MLPGTTRAILGYILHQNYLNDDIVIELYHQILKDYKINNPIVRNSERGAAFSSDKVLDFLKTKEVEISLTLDQNQVSESIHERIQALVTLKLIQKDSRQLRNWRKTVPKKLKLMSNTNKSRNQEFRQLLFESEYFQQKRFETIPNAISESNKVELPEKVEYSNNEMTLTIKQENIQSIQKVENELRKILNSEIEMEERISHSITESGIV